MLPKLLLLTEALVCLLRARVQIRVGQVVPPVNLSRDIRISGAPTPHPPTRIARAITIAARLIPGATCLVRALAAQRLLARHGYASNLHIGVANSPETGFEAHAWIEYQGRILVGRTDTPYKPLLNWGVAP